MSTTIDTTIDAAGRIVVPKRLREELRLQAGQRVAMRVHHGALEIEPIAEPVAIQKRGRFFVASAPGREPLTSATVARTRSRLRDDDQ
jgi:AbrB family looped-hinge helix DNA binding protein